ncbi:MAG TPA: alkaline phosphatase family protein [Sphingomonas sp.]|jgi:predicted AlkP superfamily pyrophosphatase or phosphodiesterase|nr:alkaline phosphatase family protein [Sphingomonas sp.]
MRRFAAVLAAVLSYTVASPAVAQPATPPKLVVVISVDQFSADLFAEYRGLWTGGFKRLAGGAVFPSGYQSHAATETCPGHSTILTGDHPSRTGIIANTWIDQKTRPGSTVYCAEDETVAGSTAKVYTPSVAHLLVPTLGDRMKAVSPATRVVSVAGKDRAALMMGGRNTDEIWFLDPFAKNKFSTVASHAGAPVPAAVTRVNGTLTKLLGADGKAAKLPPQCASRDRAVPLSPTLSVGDGRFVRKTGDTDSFRASPDLDRVTFALAGDLARDMKLGQQGQTDLLIIGASGTDYVNHRYGTEGAETCIQLTMLDGLLSRLFKQLDRAGIDYAVVLTADHGGHDVPERNRDHALPDAQRLDPSVAVGKIGAQIGKDMGLSGPVLRFADLSDVWVDNGVPAAQREAVVARAKTLLLAMPQVAAVVTRSELAITPPATKPAELWTLAERARASFNPQRSGDFVILLKPRVTPIPVPTPGYAATHGSPYDYDRRVPILFWRKGLTGFEQPNSVETIDIAPTLVALIGLDVPAGEMDGRCLDLDAGPDSSCRQRSSH